MEWKDSSSYSKGDKERIPSVWNYRVGDIRIVVHRYIHYPKDQWLLSCSPFYDKYELPQIDINKAKEAALNLVVVKLQEALAMF